MTSDCDDRTRPESSANELTALETLSRARVGERRGQGNDQVPEAIGDYRILRVLGQGGMGVVYEAEQLHPRRRVALKVVRGGHHVDEIHARLFQREAETLARLKHPSIAAIYESGHTDDGRDFFAMELVPGRTLDQWLQSRPQPVTTAELELRLRMLRAVADAVHYAHQRGVIHRDLKPSNIVVVDDPASSSNATVAVVPAVKILDFGLARITDPDAAAATLVSEVGVIKGTLPYMAPEQARGSSLEIDVRADVYALGVLMYELVAGVRPYDVAGAALAEAIRVICEDPPRPLRQSWSGVGRLDVDLETIAAKALEKEPDRRYASAAALAEDIERFLGSQPILARPPSAAYQLRKLAHRHRVAVAAAAAVLAALLVGLAGTAWGFRVARIEERRASQIAAFMQDMLSGIDPAVAQGEDTSLLRRILDDTAGRLERQAIDEIEVAAALHDTIGTTYSAIGDYGPGESHLLAGLELHQRAYGEDDARTLTAASNLASLYRHTGRTVDSERLYLETIEKQRHLLGPDHADTLQTQQSLAVLWTEIGKEQEAVELLRAILPVQAGLLGEDHPKTLITRNTLGVALLRAERLDEAEQVLVEALAASRRVHGDTHPDTIKALHNLGGVYNASGRPAEAGELLEESLARLESVFGEDHPTTVAAIHNLGHHYLRWNRLDAAEERLVHALELRRELLGPAHRSTRGSVLAVAKLRAAQGRSEEAEALFRQNLDDWRAAEGAGHPETLTAMFNLAQFLRETRRYGEAGEVFPELCRLAAETFGRDHPTTLLYVNENALNLTRLGEDEAAVQEYSRALEGRRRVQGEQHPNTLVSLNCLAVHHMRFKRWAEAEPLLEQALTGQRQRLGPAHPDTLITVFNLGWTSLEGGNPEVALARFTEARDGFVAAYGPDHPHVRAATGALASAYERQGRTAEAEALRAELRQ